MRKSWRSRDPNLSVCRRLNLDWDYHLLPMVSNPLES